MRATWRPLPVWPYPERPRSSSSFRTSWDGSLALLEREVAAIAGDDVVIGVVCEPSEISFSGALRSRAKVGYRGAEVSFNMPAAGRIAFHTDAYPTLHWNIHAIALGLEALRAVDRHGVTSGIEQYAGFAQIGPGGGDVVRGRQLVEAAGTVRKALAAAHPDHGGNARDLADVQAYRKAAETGAA